MKNQFKKILALILVILFITLTPIISISNIDNNVYATTAATGIGIKLVATILSSMGVLKIVNDNMGIDEFYQGFLEWVEDVKGILDLPQQLIQIATTAITTSAKMKIKSISDYIAEYYQTIQWVKADTGELFDSLIGTMQTIETVYEGKAQNINEEITKPLINGYIFGLHIFENNFGYTLRFQPYLKLDGEYVMSHVGTPINIDDVSGNEDDVRYRVKIHLLNTKYIVDYIYQNLTDNEIYSDRLTWDIEPIMGLQEMPQFEGEIIDTKVLSVPINLTFPWDIGIDTEDVLGLNIEALLEVIKNSSLEEYLDRLLDLPKSILDSMKPPIIGVEDGVITGVTDTTWDDVLAEDKEQTGILNQIRDRIDVMTDSLDKYFNPENPPDSEDDKGTDWGNFKGFFDMFFIFYYLIIIAILLLIKFLAVVMNILNISPNTALFDSYPTILQGINYVKGLKVGGFNITIQQIFEYMFMVFFFIYIVTTLQKLYHSFTGVERQELRHNQKDIQIEKTTFSNEMPLNNFNTMNIFSDEQNKKSDYELRETTDLNLYNNQKEGDKIRYYYANKSASEEYLKNGGNKK